jgi:hypothetical protein
MYYIILLKYTFNWIEISQAQAHWFLNAKRLFFQIFHVVLYHVDSLTLNRWCEPNLGRLGVPLLVIIRASKRQSRTAALFSELIIRLIM